MPWRTPRRWTQAFDNTDADWLNYQLRDNLLYLKGDEARIDFEHAITLGSISTILRTEGGAPTGTIGEAADLGTPTVYNGNAWVGLNGRAITVTQTGGGIPAGTMFAFASTVVPSGWLECYGQQVERTTYPLLFAALGTTHNNAGDNDSTMFRLPDYRGKIFYGRTGGDSVGDVVGDNTEVVPIGWHRHVFFPNTPTTSGDRKATTRSGVESSAGAAYSGDMEYAGERSPTVNVQQAAIAMAIIIKT